MVNISAVLFILNSSSARRRAASKKLKHLNQQSTETEEECEEEEEEDEDAEGDGQRAEAQQEHGTGRPAGRCMPRQHAHRLSRRCTVRLGTTLFPFRFTVTFFLTV